MSAIQMIVAGLIVFVLAVLCNAVADSLSAAEAVGVGAGGAIGVALAVCGAVRLIVR